MIDRPAPPTALPDLGVGPPPAPGPAVELLGGLRRVTAPNPGLMTGPGTNTYLLGHRQVVVIDPGPDYPGHLERLVAAVASGGGAIAWILVTHNHLDHAPGAAGLRALTGAPVVGFGPTEDFAPDTAAGDGWELDIGELTLRAVHTPGHASNHLCWWVPELGVLCTGDHVMEGSTVVIRPPDGDLNAYLDSLARVLELDPPVRTLAPGHGRLIGDPATAISAVIAHRKARQGVVDQALAAAGRATVEELLPTVYADLGADRLPVARFSLWAHLRALAEAGRAREVVGSAREGDPDGVEGGLTATWEWMAG